MKYREQTCWKPLNSTRCFQISRRLSRHTVCPSYLRASNLLQTDNSFLDLSLDWHQLFVANFIHHSIFLVFRIKFDSFLNHVFLQHLLISDYLTCRPLAVPPHTRSMDNVLVKHLQIWIQIYTPHFAAIKMHLCAYLMKRSKHSLFLMRLFDNWNATRNVRGCISVISWQKYGKFCYFI